MDKKLLFIFCICICDQMYSQTYIMKTNYGGCENYVYRVDNSGGSAHNLVYHITSIDGKWLCPILETSEFLIFNQKPYTYVYDEEILREYTEISPIDQTYLGAELKDCDNQIGRNYGISNRVLPFFELINNQVLMPPQAGTNSFCDRISLVASGCTGPQKFYWEYSTDAVNFTKINATTAFNQNYDFVKANFPALNNYFGPIYFRALIDWDSTIADENIYSNVANYNITSCSPLLNGDPIAAEVKCNNEPTGSVILNFKTDINSNQKLLLNLFKDNNFMTHKFVTAAEIINKSFIWTGIAAGSYIIKYQAQTTTDSNTLVGSQPVISPAFTIANVTPLTFTITAIQPLCTTDKGRIQISASGGTAPYFYVLDNESLANRHSFTGSPYIIPDELSEGDHTVMVVDSHDCIEK